MTDVTLFELREELDKLIEQGYGKLPVRLECDHGQTAMSLNGLEYACIEADEYMSTTLHPDDYDQYEDKVPVMLLSAY